MKKNNLVHDILYDVKLLQLDAYVWPCNEAGKLVSTNRNYSRVRIIFKNKKDMLFYKLCGKYQEQIYCEGWYLPTVATVNFEVKNRK